MALPLLRCYCSWLSNFCLLLSQTSVTKFISCQTSTRKYMLTHTTNNNDEIQCILLLTTYFVPPHYQHGIQMEEVKPKPNEFPSEKLFLSSCISYAVKASFIMKVRRASSIMCLKSPSSRSFLLIFDCCIPLPLQDDGSK